MYVEYLVHLNSNQESNLEPLIWLCNLRKCIYPLCVSLSLYYSGLMSWLKAKDDELLRAEAVAGVPDRVTAQITEVEVDIHIHSILSL